VRVCGTVRVSRGFPRDIQGVSRPVDVMQEVISYVFVIKKKFI
jgi:hypothetical protein